MKASSDPTDRALHKYLGVKIKTFERRIPEKIREMGESPSIEWRHNVKSSTMKKLVHESVE
jgi:hypothetical protein